MISLGRSGPPKDLPHKHSARQGISFWVLLAPVCASIHCLVRTCFFLFPLVPVWHLPGSYLGGPEMSKLVFYYNETDVFEVGAVGSFYLLKALKHEF